MSIESARQAKTEKAIQTNWIKYEQWSKSHLNDLLYNSEGELYGPRNFTEFREAWLSMDGDRKLARIKYEAQYRGSHKASIAIRKKALLNDPELNISLKDVKKMGVYEFRKQYLNPSIEEFLKKELARLKAEEGEKRLKIATDYFIKHYNYDPEGDSVIEFNEDFTKFIYKDASGTHNRFMDEIDEKDLKRKVGKLITTEFFGGS